MGTGYVGGELTGVCSGVGVCLLADGRLYSGGWLQSVSACFGTGVCCCQPVCRVSSCFLCFMCVCMCSVSVLSSSGVMPAVSPVWVRVGRTAAAVPEVIAFRKACVLSTQSAQMVSQPAPSPITCWPAAPE